MINSARICIDSVKAWSRARWSALVVVTILTFFIIGIPTDVVPNPYFGRDVSVTSWSIWVLALTSFLSGALFATYIQAAPNMDDSKSAKFGGFGAVLTYFAIGCPVCNKLALIALGYTGALQYFAPVQPYLGAASLALLAYVFVKRVLNEGTCKIPN